MPDDRQQDPGLHPAAPSPKGGRPRLRHLDDAVLDRLLEPEPEQALVGEVTLHATECEACRNTLEEWTTLFPHLDVVLPRIPRAQATAGLHPPAPRVVIPDNEPPRPPRQSHRLAWSLVAVLLAAVVVLAWQLFLRPEPTPKAVAVVTPPAPAPTPPPPADSTPVSAQGPVILNSPAVVVGPAATADTGSSQAPTARENGLAAGVGEAPEPRSAPPPAAPVRHEPEPVPPPAQKAASFPRRAPVDTQPARSGARESSPTDMANLSPTFRRIELGDGIEALGGSIRTLAGLTPEEAYIAPGRIVPGAQRDKPLVRLAYRTPGGGRLLLDQQHLGPSSASREASIAVSTSANGITVAQWIDREGFWISLAGHMDQDELLRYANQLQ